jgi:hypothetical protein
MVEFGLGIDHAFDLVNGILGAILILTVDSLETMFGVTDL